MMKRLTERQLYDIIDLLNEREVNKNEKTMV